MKKKSLLVIIIALFVLVLTGCSADNKLVGTWQNDIDGNTNTIVLNTDRTAVVSAGAGTTKGVWKVKDNSLYIDRDGDYADLMAKIPSGGFTSLNFEEDPNNNGSGTWSSEV